MRWDAGIRVARQLIEQGALGQPADARIEVSVRTPWHLWPWMAQSPRLEVMYHSIHYHDSLRFLFGEPTRVTAVHGRFPGQPETGETRTATVLEYENGLITLVDVNHHNWSDDAYARFRFLGSGGIITGTIGLLYDYPHGRVDTLSYQANAEPRRLARGAAANALDPGRLRRADGVADGGDRDRRRAGDERGGQPRDAARRPRRVSIRRRGTGVAPAEVALEEG